MLVPNASLTAMRFFSGLTSVSPVATPDLRKKECNQPRPESNPQLAEWSLTRVTVMVHRPQGGGAAAAVVYNLCAEGYGS